MRSAMQIERNCGGEHGPVLEDPVEVAEVALAPAPLPPVRRERERKVHEPGDRETEHPEEHSRADRPRRRLPHESSAALRVDPERDEERDLREHPVDVEEPLVALRALDEVGAEDRVDVDRPEREVVRNGGRVEEERGERERRDAEHDEGGSSEGVSEDGRREVDELLGLRLALRAGRARRTGSGSVTSIAYAYVCAE